MDGVEAHGTGWRPDVRKIPGTDTDTPQQPRSGTPGTETVRRRAETHSSVPPQTPDPAATLPSKAEARVEAILARVRLRAIGTCRNEEGIELLRTWARLSLQTIAALYTARERGDFPESLPRACQQHVLDDIEQILSDAAPGTSVPEWLSISLRHLDDGVVSTGNGRASYLAWTAAACEVLLGLWDKASAGIRAEDHAVRHAYLAVHRHITAAAAALEATFANPTQDPGRPKPDSQATPEASRPIAPVAVY